MNLNTRKKNGFTMIELIAVIVILGILAAAAVPKFMDMRTEAQEAVAKGMLGAFMSAASMQASKTLIDGGDFACPDADDVELSKLADDTTEYELSVENNDDNTGCVGTVTWGDNSLDATFTYPTTTE